MLSRSWSVEGRSSGEMISRGDSLDFWDKFTSLNFRSGEEGCGAGKSLEIECFFVYLHNAHNHP